MNYLNYINEVVKPQKNKSLGFKMDSSDLRNDKAPSVDKGTIIKEPFLAKRDLIICYKFKNLPSRTYLHLDIGFDSRGMCIDMGPIRIWDYSFWK